MAVPLVVPGATGGIIMDYPLPCLMTPEGKISWVDGRSVVFIGFIDQLMTWEPH